MRFLVIAAAGLMIPWLLFWLYRHRTLARAAGKNGGTYTARRETRHGRRQRGFIEASRGRANTDRSGKGSTPRKSNGPSGPIKKPWGW